MTKVHLKESIVTGDFVRSARRNVCAIALSFVACASVQAATFEDGVAAYLKGDYKAAYEVWKPIADDGEAIAMFNLGVLHAQGLGVPVDQTLAVQLYRQAAEKGYAPAQFNLGAAYRNGHGVAQSDSDAATWWQQAADQGEVQAQYNLGLLYAKGVGVSRDESTARYFFEQASRRGETRADEALAQLAAGSGGGMVADSGSAKSVKTDASTDGTVLPDSSSSVGTVASADTSSTTSTAVSDATSSVASSVASMASTASSTASEALTTASSTMTAESTVSAPAPAPAPESAPVPESAPAPAPAVQETVREVVSYSSDDDSGWIMSNDPEMYTVQLYASGDANAAARFISKHGLEGQAHYFRAISGSRTWYKVVYGTYGSSAEAKAARTVLPLAVQKNSPWIRRFARVQSEVAADTSPATNAVVSAPAPQPTETVIVQPAAAPAPAPAPVPEPTPVAITSEPEPQMPAPTETTTEMVSSTTIISDGKVTSIASDGTTTTVGIDQDPPAPTSENTQEVAVVMPSQDAQSAENAPAPPANTTSAIVIEDPEGKFVAGQRAFNQQDYATALEHWRPLADSGHTQAQYGLGFMHETGWGVGRDASEAMRWYQAAAEQGYAKAQYNLGMMHLLGNGVPEDESMGLYWIQSAADQNDLRARAQLSRLRTTNATQ